MHSAAMLHVSLFGIVGRRCACGWSGEPPESEPLETEVFERLQLIFTPPNVFDICAV